MSPASQEDVSILPSFLNVFFLLPLAVEIRVQNSV